jgi:hypothetical protein
VHPDGTGTRVHAESRNKVPFAWNSHHAAFEHAEQALRARAKRAGLDEVLQGSDEKDGKRGSVPFACRSADGVEPALRAVAL